MKPWDDETDMAALEAAVRSIEQDGLVWGAGKLVAIGYGNFILMIGALITDSGVTFRNPQTSGLALRCIL